MKRFIPFCSLVSSLLPQAVFGGTLNLSQSPLFLTTAVSPLTMLIIGKDHKLYFEAYNDASDLDGDGQIEIRFKPSIDYFGYFDSYKCYTYNSGSSYFAPTSVTSNKKCSGSWSGNFLNYVTTARLDALRKVLYGGYRSVDATGNTILQRTYVPQDGHSWGKEYQSLAIDGYNISDYTPFQAPTTGLTHLFANTTLRNGTANPLMRVALNQPYRIWEWVSIERPEAGSRAVNGGSGPLIVGLTDYVVQVKVCDSSVGLESNCRLYPNGDYKPGGVLQQFGENNSMLFGLITGTYVNNLAGGVLRKNITSFTDEVNLTTGIFTNINGIVSTLNKLTVTGFGTDYTYDCGWITTRPINNGECQMWGNPIAEMMYEAVRYFAGKSAPTPAYDYSSGTDATLGLPKPAWQDPYSNNPYCAKANMLVISDDSPSYDGDLVPGSFFNSFSGDLSPTMNVSQLGQTIFNGEGFSSLLAFIGQSGTNNNGAPTAKTVTSFGNIRGLPLEPSAQGSYYSAAVAYYAWTNDVNPAQDNQNIKTYVVALSSPFPNFIFNVGGKQISLVPFAKSVAGMSINATQGQYQPTNRIVNFYIQSLTSTSAVLRISFDDVEQGSDFDMDAIVTYTITANPNNTLTVSLDSSYAAGSIIQHIGYVISGTSQDGLYLDVRDQDTAATADIDYFLDTPPGQNSGSANWQDHLPLPLTSTRVFYPGNTPPAVTFKSPLWYAAKWGGFTDKNNTGKPDTQDTWDSNGDGTPDNYFNVSNANTLSDQLAKVFQQIVDRSGSFSSGALSSGTLNTGSTLYQAIFRTKDWSGQLLAFNLDPATGNVLYNGSGPQGSVWEAGTLLKAQNNTNRSILTWKPSSSKGIPFRWPANPQSPTTTELDPAQIAMLNIDFASSQPDTAGSKRVNYIRGDQSNEVQNGGTFRNRSSLLGDIISSTPISVGAPNQHYPVAWPASAPENSVLYSTFKTTAANRQTVVYVGSNDGMLHAFNATTGIEMMAYIPSPVYANLNALPSTQYVHNYFVDNSPTVLDALYQNTWHTVLVSGLGGGGQGVFALDVTDPTRFGEANAASLALWEFTSANDVDMGYSYGQPSIVRLNNGKWAAVFGNGYNNTLTDGMPSTTGNAVIYVVDISNGSLIKKFDTGVGMSADPLNMGRPNGMSAPTLIDTDGTYTADSIYAGDLFGNVWKIDISSANSAQWDFAYRQSGKPAPFFVAKDSSGKRQPITSQPSVSRVSYNQPAFQIYFGTGKYLETADKTDLSVQSVYALLDDGSGIITGRTQLQQQTILNETGSTRITSSNGTFGTTKGWYLDLSASQPAGERVVSNVTYMNQKIIFSTIIPSTNPCDYGGTSWLMEMDALTGNRLNYNVFDINQDGKFDNNDAGSLTVGGQTIQVPISGVKSQVGLTASPAILNAGTKEYKYMTGTGGGIQKMNENPGNQIYNRQSWRQLQ